MPTHRKIIDGELLLSLKKRYSKLLPHMNRNIFVYEHTIVFEKIINEFIFRTGLKESSKEVIILRQILKDLL